MTQPCMNQSKIENIEEKVSNLERVNIRQNTSIDHMADEIKRLTEKLNTLIDMLIKIGYMTGSLIAMSTISILAYLIVYWVKGV